VHHSAPSISAYGFVKINHKLVLKVTNFGCKLLDFSRNHFYQHELNLITEFDITKFDVSQRRGQNQNGLKFELANMYGGYDSNLTRFNKSQE
jgi:hypothetical protein